MKSKLDYNTFKTKVNFMEEVVLTKSGDRVRIIFKILLFSKFYKKPYPIVNTDKMKNPQKYLYRKIKALVNLKFKCFIVKKPSKFTHGIE